METTEALKRLQKILPLAERQRRLPPPLVEAHQAVLRSLMEYGRPPSIQEVGAMVGGDGGAAIAELARNDLVVLDHDGTSVGGAYPMTTADTLHSLLIGEQRINAMCALDALAVAPMFDTEVSIDSVCQLSGDSICLVQKGREVVTASPTEGIHVGVRWGPVGNDAAGSL